MAKKSVEETVVEEVPAVPAKVVPVVMVRPPKNKVYTIEQWLQLRKKPTRHLGGIRAFLGNEAGNKYTLEVWDAKMAAY